MVVVPLPGNREVISLEVAHRLGKMGPELSTPTMEAERLTDLVHGPQPGNLVLGLPLWIATAMDQELLLHMLTMPGLDQRRRVTAAPPLLQGLAARILGVIPPGRADRRTPLMPPLPGQAC